MGRRHQRPRHDLRLAVHRRRRRRALTQTLCAAQAALPNLQITYQPIAGDYRGHDRANDFAARDVPDLFYVNPDYAQNWIDQTYLMPLDDYIAKSGFDTSKFFPGYASIFKGDGRQDYGFPKDGNTIGMAYNTDMVHDAADDAGRAGARGQPTTRARPAARRRCASTRASTAAWRSSTRRAARSSPPTARPPTIDSDASKEPSSGTWTCSRTAWA